MGKEQSKEERFPKQCLATLMWGVDAFIFEMWFEMHLA